MVNSRGFTLVEIMIAMGIATFLIAGAMTAHVSNLTFFKTTENRTTLYQDSVLLIEYVRGELMAAGGGSVRSWMGFWVEDNCGVRAPLTACDNSDRVTISTVAIPLQECAITGQVSATQIQVAFSSPGVCCLRPQAVGEVTYLNRQVMLTLGDFYTNQYSTVVDLGLCQMTLMPGQASPNDFKGPIATPVTDWTNGVVTLMNVATFYLDTTNRLLKRWTDANNDGVKQATEDMPIADSIFDLQLALGYDFNVPDGNVSETVNGVGDEWLYNAPGVAEAFGAGVFAPPVARNQLQSLQVSLILGSDDAESTAAATPKTILNGPARSLAGWYLMEEHARLAPRNSYIFQ